MIMQYKTYYITYTIGELLQAFEKESPALQLAQPGQHSAYATA